MILLFWSLLYTKMRLKSKNNLAATEAFLLQSVFLVSISDLVLALCITRFMLQTKRSDSAFFWEERDIMAHANSEWIVQVSGVSFRCSNSEQMCFFFRSCIMPSKTPSFYTWLWTSCLVETSLISWVPTRCPRNGQSFILRKSFWRWTSFTGWDLYIGMLNLLILVSWSLQSTQLAYKMWYINNIISLWVTRY